MPERYRNEWEMVSRAMIAVMVAAIVPFVTIGDGSIASGASVTPLLLPWATAFSALGHSCGGIREQALATGFDVTTGNPRGDVYLQTRCGGSGRGGGYHSTTYSAWVGVTWDLTGAVVSHQVLATPPAQIDPGFSAIDSLGNEIYTELSAVNVPAANCSVGNTTYCSYRAYLALAPGFVPPPTVTSVSAAFGPMAGGTSVTVVGTGFLGATAVMFGVTPAASFTVNGDTSISAVTPAETPGTVDVSVTTAGGTSTAGNADQFTYVAVTLTCDEAGTCMDYDGGCKQCGSPVSASSATVTDALFMLRAAVGSTVCSPCICDVDDSGTVGAADALRTLRFAVGQDVTLDCPTAE